MDPVSLYILEKPEPYRSILLHLQSVIEKTLPEATLRYKYRIPFYYLEGKPLCYLNQSGDYVDLGFSKATHMTIHTEFMTSKGRRVVKSLRYHSLAEIDDTILREVLHHASEVAH
jgi:hypothetical protein